MACDGKTLLGSIEPISGGGSAFIAQVTLFSAALGVAIAQACYATGDNHERAVLQKLLGELDLDGKPFKATHRRNGAGVMATLRTAAMNLLRLAEFGSIRDGLQAVMHDITALLAMVRRQPKTNP